MPLPVSADFRYHPPASGNLSLNPQRSNMKPIEVKSPPEKPPTTLWGHVVQITPIVLTVLATALAGLSSSEMTQSMYCRTLAGQYQAKAGDQWAFFQAKRIRSASLDGTIALLHSL